MLHGTGNHLPLLSYDDVVIANLWSWIAQVVAISAAATGRFAVIAFLLALQGTAHRKLRWFLYIVGGAQATINAIEIVLIMLQCNPVNKLWDPEVPGTCSMIEICSKVGFLQGSKRVGDPGNVFLELSHFQALDLSRILRWRCIRFSSSDGYSK